jgi:hypothetical protein
LVFPCAASARTILPLSTTRLILQPDAQYGQTVTTFFIGLAPVNQIAHTRLSLCLCIFYAMFFLGALVDITGDFWSKL